MAVKPIPDGYHSVTPYLIINGAARALEFYKKVFGATEMFRFDGPNGTLAHAEIKVGDSVIMLADEQGDMGFRGPGRSAAPPSASCCTSTTWTGSSIERWRKAPP